MHPLIDDLATLKDNEIEARISDLSKKYFMTQNTSVRMQMVTVLDTLKEELKVRRSEEMKKMMERNNKGLDKLINID